MQKHCLPRLQRKVLVSYGTECNKWREKALSRYLLQLSVSGYIRSKFLCEVLRQVSTAPTRYAQGTHVQP